MQKIQIKIETIKYSDNAWQYMFPTLIIQIVARFKIRCVTFTFLTGSDLSSVSDMVAQTSLTYQQERTPQKEVTIYCLPYPFHSNWIQLFSFFTADMRVLMFTGSRPALYCPLKLTYIHLHLPDLDFFLQVKTGQIKETPDSHLIVCQIFDFEELPCLSFVQ